MKSQRSLLTESSFLRCLASFSKSSFSQRSRRSTRTQVRNGFLVSIVRRKKFTLLRVPHWTFGNSFLKAIIEPRVRSSSGLTSVVPSMKLLGIREESTSVWSETALSFTGNIWIFVVV